MLDASLTEVEAVFHVRARLKPVADTHIVVANMPEGDTIADALTALQVPKDHWEFAFVAIEDQPIPRELWHRVRPNAGVTLYVKVTPGVSGAIALIAALAGSAASGAAVAGIGAGTFLGLSAATVGAIAGAVVSAAVTFALTSIFAPSAPNRQQNEAESQSFSITSARNRLDPFGVVPEVVGLHRFIPPYGAAPFTEVVGSDKQFLRFVVVWGYGPVDVSDIRIGNTPIDDFDDVVADHDFDGTAAALGLYPRDVSQEDLSIVLDTTFVDRTTAIDVDEVSIDVTFPNGLFFINSRGNRLDTSVALQAFYRKVGDPDFTFWFYETVTSRQTTVRRFSKRITGLPRGQYEIRLRRFNAAQPNTQRTETAVWTAMRGFTNESPISMPGVAKSAFRIKATDQLNGVVDQLNAVVGVKVPTWNGAAWTGSSTSRNPAAVYRHVLTSAANAKARTASQIDDAGLGAWYERCETLGLYYDRVFDDQASVRDRLQDIAAAGFASPRLVDGKWGVVVDKPQTVPVQHFTPRNSNNFRGQIVAAEIPHAYRIRFPNRERQFIEDERIVYDDGYDASNATEFQTLDAPGKTDPEDVFRWGRHILAAARLRPEIFTFDVDIEHLVAERGDLIRFTHDVPRIGLTSGRVKSVDGNDITLDEPVTIEDGKTYTVRVRQNDGTTNNQNISTGSGLHSTITVSDATGIAAGDLFMFGETGSESEQLIIRAVEPNDDLGATIEAVPYREAIYNAADSIPDYESVISIPSSVSFIGPPTPKITNVISDEAALIRTADGSVQPGILLYLLPGTSAASNDASVTRTEDFEVRWRITGSGDPFTYEPRQLADVGAVRITGVETGEGYDIEVHAIGPNGERSQSTNVVGHVVAGSVAPPPPLDTFGVNVLGDQAHLEWTYPSIPIDAVSYEIRYHPDQGVTDWVSMMPLADAVPSGARSYTVPTRSGTYAIKARDVNGTFSTSALFINSTLEDPSTINNLVSIVEHPEFSGTKSAVGVESGRLILSGGQKLGDWGALGTVTALGTGSGEIADEGTYEFGETDLGGVYTSRVTGSLNIIPFNTDNSLGSWGPLGTVGPLGGGNYGDDVSAILEIATSLDDNDSPVFGGWSRFAIGDFTARHMKFRLRLSTLNKKTIPQINRLEVSIDVPDRIIAEGDIQSGPGSKTVTFSPAFNALKSINIAAQDLGSGDTFEITGKSRTGFTITFKDDGGTPVDRTFDYQAVGFGQERGT